MRTAASDARLIPMPSFCQNQAAGGYQPQLLLKLTVQKEKLALQAAPVLGLSVVTLR